MEEVKKEGFFRKFLKWLNTPDEEEVVNGNINVNAFKDEDPKLLKALKDQASKIDKIGNTTFMDKRAKTVKEIKAKVSTPKLEKQKEHSEDRVRE